MVKKALEKISRFFSLDDKTAELAISKGTDLKEVIGNHSDKEDTSSSSLDVVTIQRNRILASGLFDAEYYRLENPDIDLPISALFDHFIHTGGPEGRKAHPLFDAPYYRSLYKDIRDANINPLYHYLEHGAQEGRIPHPLFDPAYYQAQIQESQPLSITPLEHFLKVGADQGLDPIRYFSCRYYMTRYKRFLPDGANPLGHYWAIGAKEGYDPHPDFITSYYLAANPDVASTTVNPLHHYLQLGQLEGRDINPLLDATWYCETFFPGEKILANATQHYRETGAAKGFDPSPALSTTHYRTLHPEVDSLQITPVDHLLKRFSALTEPGKHFAPLRLWLRDLFAAQSDRPRHGPAISFVIPCYNQGRWIEDALISAHLSTRCPLDIIIVNDGSNDIETLTLLPELAQKYRAKILSQTNGGLSSARNAALQVASGDYIQFLDSDDLLLPNKIDAQLLLGHADMYLGDYYLCDAWCGGWKSPYPSTIKGFTFTYDSFLRNWERGLSIPIHCGLFSRDLFSNIRFAEELDAKEDWLMWLELAKKNPLIRFLDSPCVLYRQHYQNMGKDVSHMAQAYLRTAFQIVQGGEGRSFLDHALKHLSDTYHERIKQEAVQKHLQGAS